MTHDSGHKTTPYFEMPEIELRFVVRTQWFAKGWTMRIVMLSDLETEGGAAIAASRLASGLRALNQEVIRIVNRPTGGTHSWQTITLMSPIYHRGYRYIFQTGGQSWIDRRIACRLLRKLLLNLRPDVINVHNLHAAAFDGWEIDLVDLCCQLAPTVWTLHDMWSFTGRCACSYDCMRFLEGCNHHCPTPNEYPSLKPSLIAPAWRRKKKILSRWLSLAAATPSHWLAGEAVSGLWKKHPVTVIPHGLPLNVYKPEERTLVRRALEIDEKGPILLVAAHNLQDARNGIPYLISALKKIKVPDVTVLTLGHGTIEPVEGIKTVTLGFVDHERTKALVYNSADLFLYCAVVGNQPNVVLESIACGTPVVSFPVCGLPEMVRPGITGWLVPTVSPDALAETIELAIHEVKTGKDLRNSCRKVAVEEFSQDLFAERYLNFYRECIQQWNSGLQ